MPAVEYRGRRACLLENEHTEIIVTLEGGHIASVRDKRSGVNPLWSPPWPTIEPSTYNRQKHPEYGNDAESKLLSGILGHNLCLDLFGGPSEAECAAGMTVHGEASIATYDLQETGQELIQRATLPQAQLRFERRIQLAPNQPCAEITETVENTSLCDRPIAWTQHVTLGPPFLEKGKTVFQASATRSKVIEQDFTGGLGHLRIGAEFLWPNAPCLDDSTEDLRTYTNRPVSAAYTTQLMDPDKEQAWFIAWSPTHRLAFGYKWNRNDFPWLGIWEENYSRRQAPWNGKTLTRGMEFGVSPFPESRRAMIERRSLFGAPVYRWIPARETVTVAYKLFLIPWEKLPDEATISDL